MHRRWFAVLVVMLLGALGSPPALAQGKDGFRVVWFSSHDCPDAPTLKGAGSSASNPLEFASVEDLFYGQIEREGVSIDIRPDESAVSRAGVKADAIDPTADCPWVRVTGVFRWLDYYHYMGTLQSGYLAASNVPRTSLPIVENFSDPQFKRAEIEARNVEVVGRIYDLCAAADRAQTAAGEQWWLMGPCHYGPSLILTDVVVEKVHDDSAVYLLGEQNRRFVNDLFPYSGPSVANAEAAVRTWMSTIKTGVDAFADAYLASPAAAEWNESDKDEARLRIRDPQSYISYLARSERVRKLGTKRAEVKLLRPSSDDRDERRVIGCICLRKSCASSWPLIEDDAVRFVGDAACTVLTRPTDDGAWVWEE